MRWSCEPGGIEHMPLEPKVLRCKGCGEEMPPGEAANHRCPAAPRAALDPYRKQPGGGPACVICGHRYERHESSTACLRAALLAIADAIQEASR